MRNQWLEDRLIELKPQGKDKSGLAEALGIVPSGVTALLHGKRKIKGKEISLMARYLEWPTSKIVAHLSDGGPTAHAPIIDILVKGAVEAGVWREALEWPPDEWLTMSVMNDLPGVPKFGLKVRGPSMNEVYPDGSFIVCVSLFDLRRNPKHGERVVCLRRENGHVGFEATVKELRIDAAGDHWLWPLSTDPNFQQPWKLPAAQELDDNEDLRIVGIVIGSYRREMVGE